MEKKPYAFVLTPVAASSFITTVAPISSSPVFASFTYPLMVNLFLEGDFCAIKNILLKISKKIVITILHIFLIDFCFILPVFTIVLIPFKTKETFFIFKVSEMLIFIYVYHLTF